MSEMFFLRHSLDRRSWVHGPVVLGANVLSVFRPIITEIYITSI